MIIKAENNFEYKYVLQYKQSKQYKKQYSKNNQINMIKSNMINNTFKEIWLTISQNNTIKVI